MSAIDLGRMAAKNAEPADETNEDWIRPIVDRWTGNTLRAVDRLLLTQYLAAEVTSRLAEAYEDGWNARGHGRTDQRTEGPDIRTP
jgi:hypothetical protein